MIAIGKRGAESKDLAEAMLRLASLEPSPLRGIIELGC
jgi:hypothetical protein